MPDATRFRAQFRPGQLAKLLKYQRRRTGQAKRVRIFPRRPKRRRNNGKKRARGKKA